MMYFVLVYSVSELHPLFTIRKEHNVSETGYVSALSGRLGTHLLSSVC
jgi:hypothetical protein